MRALNNATLSSVRGGDDHLRCDLTNSANALALSRSGRQRPALTEHDTGRTGRAPRSRPCCPHPPLRRRARRLSTPRTHAAQSRMVSGWPAFPCVALCALASVDPCPRRPLCSMMSARHTSDLGSLGLTFRLFGLRGSRRWCSCI